MSRFAADRRVIYWEEPEVAAEGCEPALGVRTCAETGVIVVTPSLPETLDESGRTAALKTLLNGYLAGEQGPFVRWYYTPMMLPFSRHVESICTVYDCMDELANFRFAPPQLLTLEQELIDAADVVFTGGYSLYEAKKDRHANIHPFPSSVDRAHFARARAMDASPDDQAPIGRPRLGFYGVIDERMNLDLIAAVADSHPEWSIVMVGPVVKIDPADLPLRANIHYVGGKSYEELPVYLGGWDVALMPFAINESTKFISPTKTPEYLAGGRPVVSTPITDVIRHYSDLEAVFIADGTEAFIQACEKALDLSRTEGEWLAEVDAKLANISWDTTYARMAGLVREAIKVPTAGPNIVKAHTRKKYDYLVVGAGFAGSVLAERLASQHDAKVLVIDKRPHIAGNAYDHLDEAGLLIHQYGPHIFHANSDEIVDYLSKFTAWRPYEHKVLAEVRGKLVPIPINRTTLNALFDLDLKTDEDAAAYLASRAEPVAEIKTSEDVVISAVGRELYELFFQGYTRKQWGIDPSGLDKAVTARIPTRTNTDDRYFGDKHQIMPKDGYTAMFNRMLEHPNIDVLLSTDYKDIMSEVDAGHIVFTGPIDEFFDFRYGKLPYRSLRFEHKILDQEEFQPVAVVNYPNPQVPYTRITEYKYLTGQEHEKTSITYEYPSAEGDPYYPIPRPENQELFKKYEALADATPNVTFVGRLATYRYYNMDQVVGQALSAFRKIDARRQAAKAANEGSIWTEAAE
ncbi:UDP-galactopyranose mutase [Sphingosinicella sp. BN140058]|uniref:UDP-galactopyranose mutase n=1 Tax=Sphingosinicella sp. BN140058 TaxID=1892855 RepID=UPI0010113954|nr:UDP-galactopyranose mutase [Sphingosinicella sp. BN140058]QAY79814.1 UDP-galactopyranose mutase [Sphingosinicella sp. BN140058]